MTERHPEHSDPEAHRRAIEDREGWPDYRRLVLGKLDDLREDIDDARREFRNDLGAARNEFRQELKDVKQDVIGLRIKAATWGFVSGSLSAMLAALLQYLTYKGH